MKKNKKSSKKRKTKSNKIYIAAIVILLLIIASLGGFLASYIFLQKNFEKKLKKQQNVIQTLEKKIQKLEKSTQNISSSEIIDFQQALKKAKKEIIQPPREVILKHNAKKPKKPLLVIILDDMSFGYQVKEVKSIPFKITPSFFPPTKRHPNTPELAKEFPVYMIHLPLEAIHFKKPEPNTLNINDSYETIKKRIDYVKKIFPKAHFINNHTGSTFTANTSAMLKLFKALKADHLGFVDSKTTPYSKAKYADSVYKIPLFSRNIFLDNKPDIKYIQNQLKKAVKIAQEKGYAIAIGHPHKTTIEALKQSSKILKNVKVVYIDELAKIYHQ